jgi:hypothetical protein
LVLDLAPPTSGARGQEPNQDGWGWDGGEDEDEEEDQIDEESRGEERKER